MSFTAEELAAAFHYLYPDEVGELKRLTNLLPPNPRTLNIGAGSGTSSLAFLEARPDLYLVSVDKQLEDSPLGCLSAERKVLEDAGFSGRFIQVHGDSAEIGMFWDDEPFDLIFIDGDHSYEGCTADILNWMPHLVPFGLMAIHDYAKESLISESEYEPHTKPWPGVDKAVKEILFGGQHSVIGYVDSLISFRIFPK